jgi:hypothetical protein
MKVAIIASASIALAGALAGFGMQSSAYARDWDDHYHLEQRCDRDGDRCAVYRCDADRDRCTRVSGYTHRRSDWDDQHRYQSYRPDHDRGRGFITTRCDRDGDRCVTLHCDHDGDRCEPVGR